MTIIQHDGFENIPAATDPSKGWALREEIESLTKQRMAALGISEEFLTSHCDTRVSFFEASLSNRIRATHMHSEAMRKVFERTYRRIMSPRLFCRAVPGGAMLFGVRFRSLRKARVAFKEQIKRMKVKFAERAVDPCV
jgi:hypothetical protein